MLGTTPTSSWQLCTVAVGGLWAVGFAPGSDLLLVLSVNGRGVYDARTGERLARDRGEDLCYDERSETALGVGPLAGRRIEVAGNEGGVVTRRELPTISADGWIVRSQAIADFHERIELRAPGASTWTPLAEAEQVRVLGFSPTGRTLVAAEAHSLHLWRR